MKNVKSVAIEFFQFDNLVRGQIPFLLVTCQVDFKSHYLGNDLEHIQRITFKVEKHDTADKVVQEISNRKLGLDYPIVLVCPDGAEAKRFALELDYKGALNVFYVEDGMNGLFS